MKLFTNKNLLACLLIAFSSVSYAEQSASFPCNSKDLKAIDTISKNYFKEHSAFALNDLTVASTRCMNNHASANIHLKKYAAIQTNVYLKKVNKNWEVMVLGSKLSDKMLAEIPQNLRDVTETSVKS